VEFADKKTAKRVARALNCQQIGGKRRSRYYDEIWNMKYLKGFKWSNLSEKIVHDRITREQRIRREMVQANKESNLYIKRANQNKGHMAIEEKKKNENNKHRNPKKIKKIIMHLRNVNEHFFNEKLLQKNFLLELLHNLLHQYLNLPKHQ